MKPKSLFKRVFDFARAELERRTRALEAEPVPRHNGSPSSVPADSGNRTHAARSSELHGLDIERTADGALRLSWSISPDDVSRAEALLGSGAVLCVRVVAFSAARDDVVREVQDRPGVELRGACDVGTVDGRAVVSVGLRAGERFVSIAHHVL